MDLVVSANDGNSDNIAIPQWHMLASERPRNYLVSLASDHPLARSISRSGAFVVNLMLDESKALQAASGLAYTEAANMVAAPKIVGSEAHLECELIQALESGENTLFLGRVVGHSNFERFSTRKS